MLYLVSCTREEDVRLLHKVIQSIIRWPYDLGLQADVVAGKNTVFSKAQNFKCS